MQNQFNHNDKTKNELKELAFIVNEYYGDKAKHLSINVDQKLLQYIVLNSFEVIISLGDRYGEFGAGIRIGSVMLAGEILPDRRISLNADKNSIHESLKLIEDYCRLRLPDKFLEYHGW